MFKKFLTTILLVSCSYILQAQHLYQYAINSDIVVVKNGTPMKNPWGGGFNNPQFGNVDINFDSIPDLVVFDKTGDIIRTFVNEGINGETSYRYAPEYEKAFPDGLNSFAIFRDYNNDGKQDIFTYGTGGISVYKNVSFDCTLEFEKTIHNIPALVFQDSNSLVYTISIDYPNISDIDGDGDLDILSFNVFAVFVNYYENITSEEDSLFFRRADGCWGNFYENQLNDSIVLGAQCKGGGANGGATRHTGATLTALDLYANGAKDLLLGDNGYSNITMLRNGGTPTSANMISVDYHYPASNTEEIDVPTFPVTFFMDINNNGRKDLLVSPNQVDGGLDTGNVWFYDNFGANDNPNFQIDSKNLLVGDQIDVGTMAFPSLVDISGDGLKDLIIANTGYFQSYDDNTFVTEYQSQFSYYKNTGDSATPKFELVTDDYEGYSAKDFTRLVPTFGDLDNDGDEDMLMCEDNGSLSYYENVAGVGQPADFVLVADTFQGMLFGKQATPFLFDMDGDSLLDLLMGQKNGHIRLWLNQGTANNPLFTFPETDTLGGIYHYYPFGKSNMTQIVTTIDDTTLMLVVADGDGNLRFYEGLTSNYLGTYTQVDSLKVSNSLISVAAGDLTGNDSTELIVGQRTGGVMFLNLDSVAFNKDPYPIDSCNYNSVFNIGKQSSSKLAIYPNPNEGQFTLETDNLATHSATVTIYDVSGKVIYARVLPAGQKQWRIQNEDFPSGVYIVRLTADDRLYQDKLIVQ